MAANTTKCNATAGTANPTDCTGSTMRTNLGVVIGTNVEAWDADLDALAANSTDGFWAHTGAGTGAARTLTAPVAGITITNPAGIAGNPTFALANDLAALEGLSGTGIARRTGTDAWSAGTLVTNAELATAADGTIKSNISGVTASPSDNTITTVLDKLGSTQGQILYRNSTAWVPLAPGTAGQFLTTQGAAANPNWSSGGAGTGTVTSVICNGVTITASGTCPPRFGFANCTLAASAASSALTIALKDNTGADPTAASPCTVNFRNVTGATGATSQLSVTAATSLVISSGSTMGVVSSTAFRIWVVVFNDASTPRIGAFNASTASATGAQIFPLNETVPASSTAEGGAGAADSAGVIYTGTAVTSKAFQILGYIEWSASGLTAGTWTTTNLNFIQVMGPGVRKPGEPVQTIMATTTTGATGTAATYSTALSQAITPSSAANLVSLHCSGTAFSGAGLSSGYTALMNGATVLISNRMFNTNAAAVYSFGALSWIDKPNSAASVTYNVKIKGDGVNSAGWGTSGDTGQFGMITVTEIMG
jgi:hypothetical protein